VTPQAADVLADPVGVVAGLLCAAEPGLDRQMASDLVRSVAAGRAKRRRLAQALLDKPSLLAGGRSPAPRVAGDLLIALRRIAEARGGIAKVAKAAGIERESLYRALSARGNPRLSTLVAVTKAVGLKLTVETAR